MLTHVNGPDCPACKIVYSALRPVVIEFPTFRQIEAIPAGTEVVATLRARSGERARVSGPLFAPEQGRRSVGPVALSYQKYRGDYGLSRGPAQYDDAVVEGLVAIEYTL